MNPLMDWVGDTALVITAVIPLAWCLSAILRRMGTARLAYASWLVVFPALLPAGIWSILPDTTPIPSGGEPIRSVLTPMNLMASETALPWLAMLWIAGAVSIAGTLLVRQWRFLHQLRRNAIKGDAVDPGWHRILSTGALAHWVQVRHSAACPGPLVTGIIRPTLYLPAKLPAGFDHHGELVLAHEAAHIHHGDTLWNAVLLAVRSLFWFHPLVHLASARSRQDQELAADEAVTLRSSREKKLAYARLLCRSGGLESRHLGVAWIARGSLRERMTMIAKNEPNRTTRLLAFTGLLLTVGMTSLAVANPPPDSTTANENTRVAGGDPGPHPTTALEPIERVAPRWPREALFQGITGEITLVGTVNADGSLSNVEIIHSEPEGVFDDAAMEAFSQWRFRPTTMAGETATPENVPPRRVEQTILFKLDHGDSD